jgi:hypothetical protein
VQYRVDIGGNLGYTLPLLRESLTDLSNRIGVLLFQLLKIGL